MSYLSFIPTIYPSLLLKKMINATNFNKEMNLCLGKQRQNIFLPQGDSSSHIFMAFERLSTSRTTCGVHKQLRPTKYYYGFTHFFSIKILTNLTHLKNPMEIKINLFSSYNFEKFNFFQYGIFFISLRCVHEQFTVKSFCRLQSTVNTLSCIFHVELN